MLIFDIFYIIISGICLLIYTTIEVLINFLLTIIIKQVSKYIDKDYSTKRYQASINNIKQFCRCRIFTGLFVTLIFFVGPWLMGHDIFSFFDIVENYSLESMINTVVLIFSTIMLIIINDLISNNIIKKLFFVCSSIVLQINCLIYAMAILLSV